MCYGDELVPDELSAGLEAGFTKTSQPVLSFDHTASFGRWWKRAPGGSRNISEIIMCENVTTDVWINYTQDAHRRLQSSHDSAV